MIRIQLITEGRVVKQISSRVHETVVLEQLKKFEGSVDEIVYEGELSEGAKEILQKVAKRVIPAAMAAGIALGGANSVQAQNHFPGTDRSIGQHISDIFSPDYREIQRQRKYEKDTQRREWDARQAEIRRARIDRAREQGRQEAGSDRQNNSNKIYDQARLSGDGKFYILYDMNDRVSRIPVAGTEFIPADSQRMSHYLTASGRVYYVRHTPSNESITEDPTVGTIPAQGGVSGSTIKPVGSKGPTPNTPNKTTTQPADDEESLELNKDHGLDDDAIDVIKKAGIAVNIKETSRLEQRVMGLAEAQESPEQELERLKLRQNAEHGRAPLKRQAGTQARIRELEKQIKGKDFNHKADDWSEDFEKRMKQGVAEGVGNIGRAIKSLYQKIYRAGDDEIEYFYNDSPIFAQYWDEYEGDLDSIIAEVDPGELQVILDELESYVQQANLAEADYSPMAKDAQQADRIRSLKNLIAIAKEQGRRLRVQELELELKKLQGVSEGITDPKLQTILDKHESSWQAFKAGGDITDNNEFYDELFSYFADNGEMPYGVAKAREGDPVNWITNMMDNLAGNEKIGETMQDDDVDFDQATSADQASADKNIIMQIRKAADYEKATQLDLEDGSKFAINSAGAKKILGMFDKLRPDSKMMMQQVLNKQEGIQGILSHLGESLDEATLTEAEQYTSLNDVYPAGETEIWYWHEDFARDAMMGAKFMTKQGVMPTPETVPDNYVLIGKIRETNPDKIFHMMQGEIWSPEGQANNMIRASGTGHTSMSVGDIVHVGNKWLMVDRFGFHELGNEPLEDSVQFESTYIDPKKTAALIADRIVNGIFDK